MDWRIRVKTVSGFILLSIFLLHLGTTNGQVDQVCRHPLGMQDKRIPDYHLTATSSHAPGTGPKYARLRRDEGDGAWCVNGLIRPNTENEYLQIRLGNAYFISRVGTQGRYGHGTGQEFVKNYKLNYSRDGQNWFSWSDGRGVNILQGNVDVDTVKLQSLRPGIAGAKYIRIIPVTTRETTACLRAELYGCLWNSGLVSYEMPTPDDFSPNPLPHPLSMYSDDTYDGLKSLTTFSDGLGQLTDGVIGDSDVSITNSRFQTGAIGYDYVRWSRDNGKDRSVMMTFWFDGLRNFTSMKIHCNVNPGIDASLFSSIKIMFSLNGKKFLNTGSGSRLAFTAQLDANDASSRFVTVPLRHLVARALKVNFQLGQGHLLVSEVEFYNEPLSDKQASRYTVDYTMFGSSDDASVFTDKPTTSIPNNNNIPIIVGVLVGVIVLLAVIVIALYCRQRKLRKTMTPPSYSYHTGTSRGDHVVTLTPLVPSPGANGVPMETKPPMPIYQEIGPTVLPPDNLYLEPNDVVRRPPPPPYQPVQTNDLAVPSCGVNARLLGESSSQGESSNSSHYAETDIFLPKLESQPLQGVSGNNIYAVPWSTPSPRRARRKNKAKKASTLPALQGTSSTASTLLADDGEGPLTSFYNDPLEQPPEFPREKLEFVEKLGEGQFGEVQLCKADSSIRELVDDEDFALSGASNGPVLVAVKVLREGASKNAKEDFLKEVRVMSRLLDPNIVRLLAVCTNDEPFAMITEYMEHGDLNQYLRGFGDDMNPAPGKNTISNESIMKMATQIASGMEYLSSLNFVHRDLATRNCLVGSDESIRIGDFGMSRNMYQSDYYRIQGRAVLPIRWMSWECVLMGKFSSSSDVWSFGVTLWEMLSLCKYQPHAGMNDQQVIENMHHIFRRTGEEVYLPRPKRCPASLFNMIRQCWKRACEDRPTFQQLHNYLLERQSGKQPVGPKRPKVKPPQPKPRLQSLD